MCVSADGGGLDQSQQRLTQTRLALHQALATTAHPADPAQRGLAGGELAHTQRHRALPDTRGTGHRPDPPMTERASLRPCQQTTLPLIQMRQNRRKLRRQNCPWLVRPTHA